MTETEKPAVIYVLQGCACSTIGVSILVGILVSLTTMNFMWILTLPAITTALFVIPGLFLKIKEWLFLRRPGY